MDATGDWATARRMVGIAPISNSHESPQCDLEKPFRTAFGFVLGMLSERGLVYGIDAQDRYTLSCPS
jgi:hypothetical protein